MAFEVKLPDIGEGVAEGEIIRWLVKAGDAVREDQPLVEVMTDKATVEIPSPRTGTIAALHAEAGKVVPVGSVIVSIEVGGVAKPAAAGGAAAHTAPAPAAAASATQAPAGRGPAYGSMAPVETPSAAPAVRALARQLGVSLEQVRGSGPNGRITTDDVKRAGPSGTTAPAAAPSLRPAAPGASGADEQRIPVRGLRRRIAEHMRHSLDTAAHFTFVGECDMSAVVAHRNALRQGGRQNAAALTYMAYILKALVEPIRKYPLLNASFDDWTHEIVLKRSLHIGMAAATSEGLTVPVVRDVDRLPLLGLAAEVQRLAQAARNQRLKLEELQGGTFTVTSTGAKGGLLATPIIHHPQVAILGVHEVKKRAVVVDDQVVARETTNLSLSLDHRVVDGAVGAEFLYEVIARLEDLSWLTPAEIG